MTNPKGQVFQREVINFVREYGFEIEGLPKAGAKDEGDVVISLEQGRRIVAELKNVVKMDLSGWLTQAHVEADHYGAKRGRTAIPLVIHKRRGKGAGGAYVTLDLRTFLGLLAVLDA